jgi:zinc/manganese transport system substrate-binding protein
MLKKVLILGVALPLAITLGGAASAAELKAVASFTVLADIVHQVGGDRVQVTSLVGPDGDPHEFEPTPADAKSLRAADIVFVSGEGLEGWMDRLISASGYRGAPVTVSSGIKTAQMVDDGKEVTDPHVWNDPLNVKIWVQNIEQALKTGDPSNAAIFQANADAYLKKLDAMNAFAHQKLDNIPDDRRKVLTSHDAFGYFGREYKVTFLSPIGVSTESEASAANVAKLIKQIMKEGVKTYFFENSNDPRLVKQIAKATGAEPGGELYVESLSKADGPASTYEAMFRYNVEQLSAAMLKNS